MVGWLALVVIVIVGIAVWKTGVSNQGASAFGIPLPPPHTACTIINNHPVPSITVTSPNGGEVYLAGQSGTVQWTDCNIPNNTAVMVSLIYSPTGAVINSAFATGLAQNGSVNVTWPNGLPSGMVFGGNFAVKLTAIINSQTVVDSSDNPFDIENPGIVLVNPSIVPAGRPTSAQAGYFTFSFSVSAPSQTAYVSKKQPIGTNVGQVGLANAQVEVENSAGQVVSSSDGFFLLGSVSYQGAADGNNHNAKITASPITGTVGIWYHPISPGFYRAHLVDVPYSMIDVSAASSDTFTGDANTGYAHYPKALLGGFVTPYIYIH